MRRPEIAVLNWRSVQSHLDALLAAGLTVLVERELGRLAP